MAKKSSKKTSTSPWDRGDQSEQEYFEALRIKIREGMASLADSGGMVHIISRDKRWAVVKERANRATKIHETKSSAVDHGRILARKSGARLVIHKRDGTVEKMENMAVSKMA